MTIIYTEIYVLKMESRYKIHKYFSTYYLSIKLHNRRDSYWPITIVRLLFEKPSKEKLRQVPKGWTYQFYCPLPGCKYHISQHVKTTRTHGEQHGATTDFKAFPTYTLLRQHFQKIHANKSKICSGCNSGMHNTYMLYGWENRNNIWFLNISGQIDVNGTEILIAFRICTNLKAIVLYSGIFRGMRGDA